MPKSFESLLAVDIGGGTQDIFYWIGNEKFENCPKLVLPSPTRVLAAKVARVTEKGLPLHLGGRLMGGGAVSRAVYKHLEKGLGVTADEQAALTFSDDLDKVRAMGIVVGPPADGAEVVALGDLMLEELGTLWRSCMVPPPEMLAVAVCDHGHSPGYSNRKFRFELWENFLKAGGGLESLISEAAPPAMTRMASVLEQAPGSLVMDTAAAALWGALQDPVAFEFSKDGLCVVNLGNMHTVAFLVAGEKVFGVYEHHTSRLGRESLADQVGRFLEGSITNREVFDDLGHGCARLSGGGFGRDTPIVITGPRRSLADGLGWRVAAPHGDVMLSGCFGLLAAGLRLSGRELPR